MPDTTPLATLSPADKSMDDIVALAKRRGFVYPASEIYGGLRGFWDYGPLGTALKNNIRDWWWKCMVECPPIGPDGQPVSIVGLDSAIIQNPKTWQHSGHVGGFNDPMVDDTETNQRFRADHLQGIFPLGANEERVRNTISTEVGGETTSSFSIGVPIPRATIIASSPEEAAGQLVSDKSLRKRLGIRFFELVEPFDEQIVVPCCRIDLGNGKIDACISPALVPLEQQPAEVPSPYTGKKNVLTEPREFNLMLDTFPGPIRDEDNKAYLRPETAQGIFLNFKNVLDTTRVKVPFGIAQIGKSFRNEVTPRNFIFRSREFEQMEMEFFCSPEDSQKWYEFWRDERFKWWLSLGIAEQNLVLRDHDSDELAHYSNACVDVEYQYPFTAPGFGELEGVAHRGCYDLSAHSKGDNNKDSNTKLDYFDQELQVRLQNEGVDKAEIKERSRYVPHVIEPASGLTRAVLVLLCEAFTPTPDRDGAKHILSFKPRFAPVKAGIFPLVNKDGMPEVAQKLYMHLRQKHAVEYDAKQSIGKRYARMDEIGTPFCFTIDGDTLENQTVTVRHRDTLAQERIHLDKVEAFLDEHIAG
ncbi:MAG: glycine--tRNA ligase [Planctomycetota bacterium]